MRPEAQGLAQGRLAPGLAQGPAPGLVLALLGGLAILSGALFMTVGARGDWHFVLAYRGVKLAAMALVGYSIAVSTVLFQTVANNRILTPSIMGFDALYGLIQTALVFSVGSAAVNAIDPRALFLLQVAAMVVFASLLYRWLFTGAARSLHLLLLGGVVFGILFRSLSGFMRRVLDPDEFLVLQDRLFASFGRADPQLLAIAAILVVGVSVVGWRQIRTYDVLALGRDDAIGLGVDYNRAVTTILVLVAILVSVSTALVGPVTFFGLLVANLAYLLVRSHRHMLIIPAAVLLAMVSLVAGQLVLERVFAFDTALAIVIEFVGGLVFILLLVRGAR